MKLYGYWRSSATYRVRIALNLKSVACELVAVNLLADDDGNDRNWYSGKNPTALVPMLELSDGSCIRQSPAILDYLEQQYPDPALVPADRMQRARVLAFVYDIGMEVHPLNNLRVLRYLKEKGFSQEGTVEWMHHWMHASFVTLENMADASGRYCFGDAPTLADVFLIPQMYNADRWKLDTSAYPNLRRVNDYAVTQNAFIEAHPSRQSDAVLE